MRNKRQKTPYLFTLIMLVSLPFVTGCQNEKLEPGSIGLDKEEEKQKGESARDKLELFNIGNDLDMFIQFSNKEMSELKKLDEEYGDESDTHKETMSNEELAALFAGTEENKEEKEELSESEQKKLEKKLKSCIVLDDYIANVYQLALARLSADIEHVYTASDEYMSYIAMLQNFADAYTENEEDFRTRLLDGDMSVKEETCFQAFEQVENYYIGLYENE